MSKYSSLWVFEHIHFSQNEDGTALKCKPLDVQPNPNKHFGYLLVHQPQRMLIKLWGILHASRLDSREQLVSTLHYYTPKWLSIIFWSGGELSWGLVRKRLRLMLQLLQNDSQYDRMLQYAGDCVWWFKNTIFQNIIWPNMWKFNT